MSPRTGTLAWITTVLDCQELDATEALLVIALADHVGGDDQCFVGIRTLAEQARCSYATARRRLQALEQRGFIARSQRHRDDGANSVYDYLLVRSRFGLPDLAPAQSERRSSGGPARQDERGGSARPGERAEVPRDEPPLEPPPATALFEDDPQPAPQAVDEGPTINQRANTVAKAVVDTRHPKPVTPFMGIRQLAKRFLEAGHDDATLTAAMIAAPTITTGAIEFALNRPQGAGPRRLAPPMSSRELPDRLTL